MCRKQRIEKKYKNKNEITRRLEDIYKYFEVMQMNYIMFLLSFWLWKRFLKNTHKNTLNIFSKILFWQNINYVEFHLQSNVDNPDHYLFV